MVLYEIFGISFFRRHNNTRKIFIFTYHFMRFTGFFLLRKNEGNSGNKNHGGVLTLYAGNFLLQYNAILLCLKSLKY